MRISPRLSGILLVAIFLVAGGCTDSSNPLAPQLDQSEASDPDVEIPQLKHAMAAKSALSTGNPAGEAVYTFDDLPVVCQWNREFPESYHDLVFSESRFLAACEQDGDVGIVPVDLRRQNEQTESRITLPNPATEVSISYFGLRVEERERIFVAYDEDGLEIDRAIGTSVGTWGRLMVTGTIHQVGIIDNQSQTVWDDLTLVFDAGNSAPTSDAGAGHAVLVFEPVALDGSLSSDPDGDGLTFAWSWASRPDGSIAEFSDAESPAPTFTPDLAGTYAARLVVSDGANESAPDIVEIVVLSTGEALSNLRNEISRLKKDGTLNKGQWNSLSRMLDFAATEADRQPGPALNKLNAFINHVEALAQGDELSAEQGEALVRDADRIAAALSRSSNPS